MKKKILGLLAGLMVVLGLPLVVAPAASADIYSNQCSIGGYNFSGYVQYHLVGGTIIFDAWSLGYVNGPTPVGLEYHVRAWDQDAGAHRLIYDTGYVFHTGQNRASASPGVALLGSSEFLLQAGRTNDNYPTCTIMDLHVTD